MLYAALALIVVACALLAAAVTIAPVAAWGSILCSVLGVIVLLVGRHNRPGDVSDPTDQDAEQVTDDRAQEDTDVVDFLLVAELTDRVLVVDEHPRYHLAGCALIDRQRTIALPVSQARHLGFTPCARCGPDAALAAQHRGME